MQAKILERVVATTTHALGVPLLLVNLGYW